VSARLGARSIERYRRLGAPLASLVRGLDAVLCQTADDRRRWLELGARPERTEVVGNLKHDAVPPWSGSRKAARVELGLDQDRPLLVLGSLRPGEARILARAWARMPDPVRARWQVVAVPRHPRATAELRAEAAQAGIGASGNGSTDGASWRWDDRGGVLNPYYASADLAFVGGSLLAYGGHNPIEPAAFGAAVLMGAHHTSQSDSVAALAARGAIRVVQSDEELEAALATLLADEALCVELGRAARQVVEERRGAARRAVARLATLGLWPVER
jgi:3-deoxy-D-manno-octulosonic-acid transferase